MSETSSVYNESIYRRGSANRAKRLVKVSAGLASFAHPMSVMQSTRHSKIVRADFDESGISLLIDGSAEDFPWLEKAGTKIALLLGLGDGWNSYGAKPIKKDIASYVLTTLLPEILSQGGPTPTIVPTVQGGLQLEWHTQGVDFEIEIDKPFSGQYSFEDSKTSTPLENSFGKNLSELRSLVMKAFAVKTESFLFHLTY